MATSSRPLRRHGFTLVELLVVIGIIALLISILMPALTRARQSANTVRCLSSLRQIGQAMHMYAAANKGSLPIGQLYFNNGAPPDTDWTRLILPYLKTRAGTDYSGNDGSAVFRDTDIVEPTNAPEWLNTDKLLSYSCHRILFGEKVSVAAAMPKPYKLSSLKGDIILVFCGVQIGDKNWRADPIAWQMGRNPFNSFQHSLSAFLDAPWWAKPPVGPNQDAATFAIADSRGSFIRFRHMRNTTANFVFADGHAAGLRWTGPGSDGRGYSELEWYNLFPKK